MRQNITIWSFVAGVVITPILVFAVAQWHETRFARLPEMGDAGHRVGHFTLHNQHGGITTEKSWNNKIVVANFFFSSCPVICPKMMRQLKRVQASGGEELLISSFSIDPDRDSVQQLKKYADKMEIKNNWLLLTGNKKEIYLFARKDLLVLATDGDGGPEDFIHSDNLALIDQEKRIRGFYKGVSEEDVNRLINDIQKLKTELK